MSIATYSALVSKMMAPTQLLTLNKNGTMSAGTGWNSPWPATGLPLAGVSPGAAAIPTSATLGAVGQANKIGTEQRVFLRRYGSGMSGAAVASTLMLVDRIAHMSGLSGTNTGVQAVNTPALTRYVSGVDVFAGIEIYTAIGGTATTISMTYTNQSGVAGQVSPAVVIGGGGSTSKVVVMTLAAGDYGVQSVQSVQLAATTGIAGDFGVTLFKPLGLFPTGLSPYSDGGQVPQSYLPMPAIVDNACLQLIAFASLGGGSASNIYGELGFFED